MHYTDTPCQKTTVWHGDHSSTNKTYKSLGGHFESQISGKDKQMVEDIRCLIKVMHFSTNFLSFNIWTSFSCEWLSRVPKCRLRLRSRPYQVVLVWHLKDRINGKWWNKWEKCVWRVSKNCAFCNERKGMIEWSMG